MILFFFNHKAFYFLFDSNFSFFFIRQNQMLKSLSLVIFFDCWIVNISYISFQITFNF